MNIVTMPYRLTLKHAIQGPAVTRLPLELLAYIFIIYATIAPEPQLREPHDRFHRLMLSPDPPKTNMGWVSLMLVCRHWRCIGLETPTLWRIISVTENLDSLKYRLDRSAGCTIDLILNDSDDPVVNVKALPSLLMHAKRIRSIKVRHWFRFHHLHTLKPLFNVELPALERVSLAPWFGKHPQTESGQLEVGQRHGNVGLSVTRHPHIRHLKVHGITLPEITSFWSLMTLEILLDFGSGAGQLATDVLALLTSLSSLKSLIVLGGSKSRRRQSFPSGIPSASAGRDGGAQQIDLPFLRQICLDAPYEFAHPFISTIRFHALLRFYVSTDLPTYRREAADVIDQFIPQVVRKNILRHMTNMRLSSRSSICISQHGCLHGSDISKLRMRTLDDDQRDFSLHFDIPQASEIRSLALSTALFGLSRSCQDIPLQYLQVQNYWTYPLDGAYGGWVELFATFPELQTLSLDVDGYSTRAAFNALLTRMHDPDGQGCATLGEIVLTYQRRRCSTLEMHEVLSALLKFLRARAERGHPKFYCVCLSLLQSPVGNTQLSFRPHRWTLSAVQSYCSWSDINIALGRYDETYEDLFLDYEHPESQERADNSHGEGSEDESGSEGLKPIGVWNQCLEQIKGRPLVT